MIKKTLSLIYLVFVLGNYTLEAQSNDQEQAVRKIMSEIELVKNENEKLRYEVRNFNARLHKATLQIDSLQRQLKENRNEYIQYNEDLNAKISTESDRNNDKISLIHSSISKKTILIALIVIVVLIISSILFWWLIKKQKNDKEDVIDQLSKTKIAIEENLVKEFTKQTSLIETQIQAFEESRTKMGQAFNFEPDHSLAMKLADEIALIERNVSLMDSKTKGLKQLVASIGKLKDNLAANGYEMPDLIGRQFHQGMKVIVVSSIPDENLEKGSEIITKIFKPQVNYKDKMIQTAQIEVSIGA